MNPSPIQPDVGLFTDLAATTLVFLACGWITVLNRLGYMFDVGLARIYRITTALAYVYSYLKARKVCVTD